MTRTVHSDGPAPVLTIATQEGGVGQTAARWVELRHEGIPIDVVARVKCAWRGGEVTGTGNSRHVGVAHPVNSDREASIVTTTA